MSVVLKPCLCGRDPKIIVKEVCKDIYPNLWIICYGCVDFDHQVISPQLELKLEDSSSDFHRQEAPIVIWNTFVNQKVPNDFIAMILHGDDAHRAWLKEAQIQYNLGKPIPPLK